MPFGSIKPVGSSKVSILIIEDDSRISRVLRTHLEDRFPGVRVTIGGSAAKAREVCERFFPTFIVWDGAPNERGTLEEYVGCVPDEMWKKVIVISVDEGIQQIGRDKGAQGFVAKEEGAVNTWAEKVGNYLAPLMGKKR